MQDLKAIFSYLKPYRRDLWLAVTLIFMECIFEMIIPLLMTDIIDIGVPNHDLHFLLWQGGKMILCALLALVTGLLYARFAARPPMDSAPSFGWRNMRGCSSMPSPISTTSPLHHLSHA